MFDSMFLLSEYEGDSRDEGNSGKEISK
jgi:hypothetical protein